MSLIRGDALRIPLRSESVDLVVTSPPYFALRSYTDNGEHYDGQIGSEPTPAAFVDALVEVTVEHDGFLSSALLSASKHRLERLGLAHDPSCAGPTTCDCSWEVATAVLGAQLDAMLAAAVRDHPGSQEADSD